MTVLGSSQNKLAERHVTLSLQHLDDQLDWLGIVGLIRASGTSR